MYELKGNDGAERHLSDAELAQLQLQLELDLKARFESSIEAFSKYLPDVARAFKNYQPKRSLQFFCAENGEPNLMFPDEGGRVFYDTTKPAERTGDEIRSLFANEKLLGSVYKVQKDPYGQISFRYFNELIKEAESIISSQPKLVYTPSELKCVPNFVILGIGLGYPLSEALSCLEIANLIAIEPDPDIFYASLYACDWAGILKFLTSQGAGFKLIVGKSGDALEVELKDFYTAHGEFLTAFNVTYVHYASDEIKKDAEYIVKKFNALHSSMGFFDDHLFGVSHGIQSMLMGKRFVKRDVELPSRFRKWPLFVVGNGPSLDQDIPFLRRNQDKAVIIACGTALDTLYHAGIKPDFYAATERTPEISETLDAIPDQDFKDQLILIAGDVIHPLTSSRFKHTAIFGKPDEPFFWMCAGHPEMFPRIRPVDVMNPFVGNLGVASIFGFGFTESYLFGLDCGRKIGDAMHSKFSTVYGAAGVSDRGGNYNVSQDNALEGNFGGRVQSGALFRLSVQFMELVIREHRFFTNDIFRVFNCSDGARITGTVPAHSQDLDFEHCGVLKKKELTDFIESELTFVPSFAKDDVQKLANPKIYSQIVEQIRTILRKRPAGRMEAVSRLMLASEYAHLVSSSLPTAGYGYFVTGTMQTMFMTMMLCLFHIEDERAAVDAVWNSLMKYYRYFLEDSEKLFALIPDYVLGQHYKFMDGNVGWEHGESKPPKAPPYPHLFRKEFNDPLKKFIKRYI